MPSAQTVLIPRLRALEFSPRSRGSSPPPDVEQSAAPQETAAFSRSRRRPTELPVQFIAGPRNHIDPGASPPDPLDALSRGASTPRSGRVARFAFARARPFDAPPPPGRDLNPGLALCRCAALYPDNCCWLPRLQHSVAFRRLSNGDARDGMVIGRGCPTHVSLDWQSR